MNYEMLKNRLWRKLRVYDFDSSVVLIYKDDKAVEISMYIAANADGAYIKVTHTPAIYDSSICDMNDLRVTVSFGVDRALAAHMFYNSNDNYISETQLRRGYDTEFEQIRAARFGIVDIDSYNQHFNTEASKTDTIGNILIALKECIV
jgi:hypothetical protein